MSDTLFVVVWDDRHDDDDISLHKTENGARERMQNHCSVADARYRTAHDWSTDDCPAAWEFHVMSDDDGPSGYCVKVAVQD
jgi:hypothetical protein